MSEQMTDQAPDDGYTIWSVHRRAQGAERSAAGGAPLADEIAAIEAEGVVVRGIYDVSGLRHDADVMVWMHGSTPQALQAAVRRVRRSRELAGTTQTWGAMGVHRDAEFNKRHVPGYMRGIAPKQWLTVYPFNRSYDWYLLPPEDRSRMLAEHGRAGAAFRGVVANTVSAFALGDYEWLLPLEADELTELVDMMRELRNTEARLHVREEIPFYTGRRIAVDEIEEVLA
ncbi:MAG: hydrogen peroxide-dependent heme synthase [Actinomycetota bacterium]